MIRYDSNCSCWLRERLWLWSVGCRSWNALSWPCSGIGSSCSCRRRIDRYPAWRVCLSLRGDARRLFGCYWLVDEDRNRWHGVL